MGTALLANDLPLLRQQAMPKPRWPSTSPPGVLPSAAEVVVTEGPGPQSILAGGDARTVGATAL